MTGGPTLDFASPFLILERITCGAVRPAGAWARTVSATMANKRVLAVKVS
jgi:hypothetical protein